MSKPAFFLEHYFPGYRTYIRFFLAFKGPIWYHINMENSIYNIDFSGLTYGRGYVYSLQYHIVWCTKYRKQILQNGVDTDLKEMLQQLAEEYQFRILAMEVMPDHVHLLLDCRPQFRISDMVKILKGNTARWLFLKRPELKRSLWGGHLWNPSYCAVTVSDRSGEDTSGTRLTVRSLSVTAAGNR